MATEKLQFITQQIRAKYLWQKVLVFIAKDYKGENRPFKCILKPKDIIAKKNEISYLQLRSIEALTDDEYIQVALLDLCCECETEEDKLTLSRMGKRLASETLEGHANNYKIHVYLTQIGIALPHIILLPNGEVFTASVEWLIENNIIKI